MPCCAITAWWCENQYEEKMKRALQSLSLLLLLGSATAHAQLYKWVAPDGKVTYSDTPPPAAATRVETKPVTSGSTVSVGLPFELSQAMKNHPVTLYTTRDCVPCDDGRKLLSQRGVPFSEKTVHTNEDILQFRQVAGDSQLPVLTVGRTKESGFEASVWNAVLTAAGYPETSRLPKTYRNPPAQAAAPKTEPVAEKNPERTAESRPASPPATELPPAAGNAPPGFRF
jgi:glutaredoxin